MIISAEELNKNKVTREQIVDMFCENLMNKIIDANAKGNRKICFDATVWCNKTTKEISPIYRNDWRNDGVTPYEYSFDDYAEDIKKRFINAGYIIKPTGYIGGVWQKTEDIMW